MALSVQAARDLNEAVERARREAEDAGELRTGRLPKVSPLSDEALAIFTEWVDDGGYERALADVIANDPDLAS